MAKKIEIYENTLLKLLVRRGIDIDRKNVILSEGELGYTTDTKKLYVGDGQTPGGILVQGNSILESTNDITSLSNAIEGDIVFRPSDSKLYRFKGGDYAVINNWEVIGGSYSAGDGTINITNNVIRVGQISAGNISPSALGDSLSLDDDGKLTINSQDISVDSITTSTPSGFLSLPGKLKINTVEYNWPSGGAGDTYLKRDASGNLNWTPLESTTTVLATTTASQIPVGTIVPFVSSTGTPSGWLLCNGQSVLKTTYSSLFNIISTTYGSDSTTFKLPDLTNKTLYGVQNTPSASTLYGIASSATSLLSATGALFLIKAVPDPVAAPTMSVTFPLTCSVDGVDRTGDTISTYEGEIVIGPSSTMLLPAGSTGFRNKAINGNFDFWQRATATVDSPVNAVTRPRTADRWATYASGPNAATFSVTRQPCTTIELDSFNSTFYQRLTYKNGVGASTTPIYGVMDRSDVGVLAIQNFENAAEILGKTVTLSFWARASQPTKIFSESQIHSTGAVSMWTPTIHKVFNLTTSWQKFTHTYTMPTFQQVSAVAYDPTTIPTNTEVPVYTPLHLSNSLPPLSSWLYQIDIKTHWTKRLSIQSGNAWSGTTSYRPGSAVNYPGEAMTPEELFAIDTSVLSGSQGYYDIAQVQLEEGSTATNFEFKPPGTELALCQRYYYKTYDVNTPPNTVTDENSIWSHEPVSQLGGGVHIAQGSYAVPMARVPNVYFYNPRNSSATVGVSGSVFVSGATGDNGTVGAVDRGTKRVSNFNISYTKTPAPAYDIVIVGYHFTADAEI